MAEAKKPAPRAAVVDDDRLMRQLIRQTLEADGYDVVEAETGTKGLRLAQDRPDVVVLDLQLPDLNGIAVCRAIKGNPATADVGVVFLTGTNDERTVVSCFQAGASDYVSKPFAASVLSARVGAVVKARLAEQTRKAFVEELSEAYSALRAARAEAMLRHHLSGLGVLAAGIAHEMNTPLGVLVSSLRFLQDELKCGDEDAQSAIADAISAANGISELITRMRAIAGSGERHFKKIDLRARCEEVSATFAGPSVRLEVKGETVCVTAVETEVREGLIALVENAVQAATSAGGDGARVEITVGVDADTATVTVDDNGPGIAEEDLPFLFDPFFTKKRVWKTRGLGLSIAQAAARRHGGGVEVEAHGPLGGARARLSLPRAPRPAS